MSLKITDKEIVEPVGTDAVVGVKDPGGTPLLKLFTIDSLLSAGGHLKKATKTMSNDDLLGVITHDAEDGGGAVGSFELVEAAEGKIRFPLFIAASLDPWNADYVLDSQFYIAFVFLGMPPATSPDYTFDEDYLDSDGWYGGGGCFLERSKAQMAIGHPAEIFYNMNWGGAPGDIDSDGFYQEANPQSMANKPIVANFYNGASFPNPITGGDPANEVTWTVFYFEIDVPVEA